MSRSHLDQPDIDSDTLRAWSRHIGVASVDPVEVRYRLGAGTLPAAFSEMAQRRPDLPALTIGDRTLTHGELDSAAARAAAAFERLGTGPGRNVMLITETGMDHVIAYLGLLRSGAGVVLVDPSLTPIEVGRMAAECDSTALVGSGQALKNASRAGLSPVEEVVGLDPEDRDAASVLLADLPAGAGAAPHIDPDSPAILAFTSGTTGRPKCAPLSHRNLLASIRGVMWAWRWGEDDHLIHTLPLSHQHGLGGIHATLLAGSRATLLPKFDAELLLETALDVGASIMFAVPTIHQSLLAKVGPRVAGLARLRLITSGSAPLPVHLARRLEDVIGQVPVERYGTTESGLDVSNPYMGTRVPGAIGLPLPGVEISIVDDDGDPVRPGAAGEVVVRGPQVFAGYLGTEPEAAPFLHDWFRTGDVGARDEESGYLRLVGRIKEVIITGGMNVYPREVEDALRSAPDVSDIAVVGVPSERWGEEVVAFVSPAGVQPEQVAEVAVLRLAAYKRPKRIYAVAKIPRSSLGKVVGADLVALAQTSIGWSSPPAGI